MKRAQILRGMVHWVFDAADYPEPPWPAGPDGIVPVIVDLAGGNEHLAEGDGWNPVARQGVPQPIMQPKQDSSGFELAVPIDQKTGERAPWPGVRWDCETAEWELVEAVKTDGESARLMPVFDRETFEWRLAAPEETGSGGDDPDQPEAAGEA